MKKKKYSPIMIWHYIRLVYRLIIFAVLLTGYVLFRLHRGESLLNYMEWNPVLVTIVCLIFVAEMIFRFFPSRIESPGCQKQFAHNYIKTGETEIQIHDNNATLLVALIWIVFNGIFGALHMTGILDDGFMLVLCSIYSVCDMICILFYCPFQSLFLKNKCCVACRIYNWDYAMMFTPLFFVRKDYLWTLLVIAVVLLFRWEITFYRHPERFSEKTNDYLNCKNCKEKLCAHKKQLAGFRKHIEAYLEEKTRHLK